MTHWQEWVPPELWPPGDILNFIEQDFKNVRAVYKTLSYLSLPPAGELHVCFRVSSTEPESCPFAFLFFFLNLLSVLSTSCFLWQGQCCHGNPGHYWSIMASYHTAQLTIYLQLLSQWCCMFIEKHSKRSANLHKSNIFKLRISDMTKAYYIMILIRFDIR